MQKLSRLFVGLLRPVFEASETAVSRITRLGFAGEVEVISSHDQVEFSRCAAPGLRGTP